MKQNYERALTEVLKFEGGYGNDPQDPGGPTNYGITIADYRRFINPNGTATDVRRMTVDQAKAIYKDKYWAAMRCDLLPSGVDYCIFDYGVNSGIGRAKRILGKFSKVTDPVKKINAICDERMSFLRSLSTFGRFGKGWTARVTSVRNVSIQMAHQPTPVSHTVAATGAAAAATATAATVVTTHPHYWPYVLVASLVAVLIGFGIYLYKKGSK